MAEQKSFLGKLAARYDLSAQAQADLAALAEWSVSLQIAGTSVRSVEDALDKHIADGLAGLDVPPIAEASTLVDIGSGVGFPGLVLAAARPQLQVTLVDSVRKKMEAAADIARELGLANVECVWARVEEISAVGGPARESFDVVSARALASLNVLIEYAAPLAKLGGALVAWKGSPTDAELDDAVFAESQLGFDPGDLIQTRPFAGSQRRHFYVTTKNSPISERYPRRPGAALKNPLTAPAK